MLYRHLGLKCARGCKMFGKALACLLRVTPRLASFCNSLQISFFRNDDFLIPVAFTPQWQNARLAAEGPPARSFGGAGDFEFGAAERLNFKAHDKRRSLAKSPNPQAEYRCAPDTDQSADCKYYKRQPFKPADFATGAAST